MAEGSREPCRNCGFALATAVLLAACVASEPLPPPGADGARLRLWREPGQEPMLVEVEVIRQVEVRPPELALSGLALHAPVYRGALDLRAPGGSWLGEAQAGRGQLRIDGPIAIDGRVGGQATVGRALGASLDLASKGLELYEVELVMGGQFLQVGRLELPADWGAAPLEGSEVVLRPAPALLGAVLGGLTAFLVQRNPEPGDAR